MYDHCCRYNLHRWVPALYTSSSLFKYLSCACVYICLLRCKKMAQWKRTDGYCTFQRNSTIPLLMISFPNWVSFALGVEGCKKLCCFWLMKCPLEPCGFSFPKYGQVVPQSKLEKGSEFCSSFLTLCFCLEWIVYFFFLLFREEWTGKR